MTDPHFAYDRPQSPVVGLPAPRLAMLLASLWLPLAAHGAERAEPSGRTTAAAPAGLAKSVQTSAGAPPAGRYRCYQPPRYTVVSWFDLETNGTYRVLDHDPAPYRYEAATRRVTWLKGDHTERGWVGLYLPPASDGAGGIRHTIVMTSAPNFKPPKDDRDTRPQCYLTTH